MGPSPFVSGDSVPTVNTFTIGRSSGAFMHECPLCPAAHGFPEFTLSLAARSPGGPSRRPGAGHSLRWAHLAAMVSDLVDFLHRRYLGQARSTADRFPA